MRVQSQSERDYVGWTKYVWLIYAVPFVVYPFLSHASAIRIALTLAATAVFLALYLAGYRARGNNVLPIIAALTFLGVIFLPSNLGAGAFFIYAASFAGTAGGMQRALGIVAAVLVILFIDVAVIGMSPMLWWWSAVFTIVVGAVNAHFAQVGRAHARLRMAQDEIEHLAKVAERERIARDLHDVLGHTLSLIILKSELASKLADRDPQRAREEIRDVERISREALSEVRQAVRGYRAGLQREIDSAAEMLRAASIELSTKVEPVPLAPAQEAILALALREAVTNVVRHAAASCCTIELLRADDEILMIVTDNGRGGAQADGAGISGMRERITTLGGRVTRDGSRGTVLMIALPLASGPQGVRAIERSA
jgi:two-component system sensor histidine kinase DesK